MNETTEKQKEVEAIIQSIEEESASFKRMSEITKGLLDYSKQLESQVTSLTKERDELKADVNENHEAATVFYTDWIEEQNKNISLEIRLSKAEEENKELKGNSEIFYIDPDDPYLEERSSLELAASMVSFNGGPVAELQVYAKKRLPNIFIIKHGCEHKSFTTKEEALASLNKSKEEEE